MSSSAVKKLYIKTYGCQMNVYDSLKIQELLAPHGFVISDTYNDADMVVLNTCHIREKASEKTFSELGRIKRAKDMKAKKGEKMVIAVTGCVAQAEGEEIVNRAKFVDIVVGPQSYQNLPKLLEEVKRSNSWAVDLQFAQNAKFDQIEGVSAAQGPSAFLAIQEGCDKFCHFCVVPYTRGAEFSRPLADLYREAMQLVNSGSKEIQLLGQNVSAYHGVDHAGKSITLAQLIAYLAKIPGLERLSYSTSHPMDMVDEELFLQHNTEKKLLPYLHLPVQSGSDAILEKMNRRHNRQFYLDVIQKFRAARPDMAFSSDFIVGYPGETDDDFAATMDLIKQVQFAQCYAFKYSIRPGTPASMLQQQISEAIKDERLALLQALVREQQVAFNTSKVGKVLHVLFDKPGLHAGQISGKSEYMQAVAVEASQELIGSIAPVLITDVKTNSLVGKLL